MSFSKTLPLVVFLATFSLVVRPIQQPVPPPSRASTGSASGIVLDDKGKPLAGATVYGHSDDDASGRAQFHVQSNDAGEFVLPGLPQGLIYLDAFKESDGYPYNFFSFFASPGENTPVKFQIKAGEVVKGVRIQLGARAARLNIKITEEDGQPIVAGASLFFTRLDQPGVPYGRGARSAESLLVPPVPFHLMIQAEGYKDWHYGGSPAALLALKPGETFDLSVHLEKLK